MGAVETERLLLRPWAEDDSDALAAVLGEPAVWHYPVGRAFTREESERFLDRQMQLWEAHGFGMWAAELKDGRRRGRVAPAPRSLGKGPGD